MFRIYYIILSGYIGKSLNNIIKLFIKLYPSSNIINLPLSKKKITIIKSPHIFKKSREQFESIISKKLLIINIDEKQFNSFNNLLKGIS